MSNEEIGAHGSYAPCGLAEDPLAGLNEIAVAGRYLNPPSRILRSVRRRRGSFETICVKARA
ncbi:hypothetical protein REMIM1_CH02654 [Rhizobium etli bv. mimosae str. Mim1]|nr:hypothetical protein REMIM1_CH02654 [Rhizobium etli bv. mimosae str. Mim1]